MGLAALAGRHSAHHLSAVLDGLLAVERALLAGESLADDTGVSGQDQVLASRIVRAVASNIGEAKAI